LKQILNKPVGIGEVIGPVIQSFCDFFRLNPVPEDLNWSSVINRAELSLKKSLNRAKKDQIL
jgi:hypothetical protein